MNVDQLADEIARQLAFYSQFVDEEIEEVAKEVTQEAAMKLKQISPVADYSGGGKYASGWKVKKVGKSYVVHNAKAYQLTHLLEKGHATRDGGRTQPQPHIKPVEEMTNREFEERLIRRIQE